MLATCLGRIEQWEGEASECMEGPVTAGTEVEAAETGDSIENRGMKRAGNGMKTAKRKGTFRMNRNRKKGEERNGVEAVW